MRHRVKLLGLVVAWAALAACGSSAGTGDGATTDVAVSDTAPSLDDAVDAASARDAVAFVDGDTADDAVAPADVTARVDVVAPDAAPVRCTGAQPTSIGGDVYGYPDNRSINVAIGVELLAGRTPVDDQGRPCAGTTDSCIGASNYAFMPAINPTLAATGAPESTPGLVRAWSHCVAASVTSVYYEGYPRNPTGHTDESRYGETMSNAIAVTPGATLRYAMRFPLRSDVDPTGVTGSVAGWARCNGAPVAVTRINAWSRTPNDGCGVHAYQSGGDIGAANGYWSIGPLAGGQCGAASQDVGVVLVATCNGASVAHTVDVGIISGRALGAVTVDF